MKKIIILSLISVFSLLTITGCKKENKPEEFSLVGKTYAGYYHYFLNNDYYISWRFISETEVEETEHKNSPNGQLTDGPFMGTYILNYPKLIVTIVEESNERTYECEFVDETCFRTKLFMDNLTEMRLQ